MSRPRPQPVVRPWATRLLTASLAATLATAAGAADVDPFDYQASGATLTYTIEISGQAQTGHPQGEWSRTQIHQRLQGTLHLRGQRETFARLDNPGQQIARAQGARQAMAGQMPAMEKIAEECGDDDNCAASRVMALVNGLSPHAKKALVATAHGPAARTSEHTHGGWVLDGKTPCSIRATSQGTTHARYLNDSEGGSGFINSDIERQGQGRSDCVHDPLPKATAEWDGDKQTLEMTLPGLTLAEQWRRSDGDSGTHRVSIPDVELKHLRWSGKGAQSGQQTRRVQADTGDGRVPATMTIHWTFKPGQA